MLTPATEWRLTVGDGTDWYAGKWYWGTETDFGTAPTFEVGPGQNRNVLQNTPYEVRLPNVAHDPEAQDVEGEDWIALDIITLPERASIPSDATVRTIGDWEVGVRSPQSGAYTLYFIDVGEYLFQIQPWYGEDVSVEQIESAIGKLQLQ